MGLQEKHSVKPPKQNSHYVVVERDHFQSYLPRSGINKLFLMLEVKPEEGGREGSKPLFLV